jgi:hypothetical protein
MVQQDLQQRRVRCQATAPPAGGVHSEFSLFLAAATGEGEVATSGPGFAVVGSEDADAVGDQPLDTALIATLVIQWGRTPVGAGSPGASWRSSVGAS